METVRTAPNRLRTLFWSDLNDEGEIHDTARNGYYACLFICLTILVMMVAGSMLVDGLVDISFFLMAGCGIRQLSRLASVSAFLWYVIEKALALTAGQVSFFSFLAILVAAILFNAVRAAYAARELRPAGDVSLIANQPVVAGNVFIGYLEALPWILWPKIHIAFRIYLVGIIALVLIKILIVRLGLLQL